MINPRKINPRKIKPRKHLRTKKKLKIKHPKIACNVIIGIA